MSHRKKNKRNKKTRTYAKQRASLRSSGETVPTIQIPRPDINGREQIIIVPELAPAAPGASIPRSPEGSPGSYIITFLLSIPGKEQFRDELDLNKLIQSGDSLLLLPQEVAQVQITLFNDKETVLVTIVKNDHGALARAQLQLFGSNFVEAETNAYNIVMPLLSRLSYLHDVAIDITGYQVIEEQTGSQKWMVGLIGKAKAFEFNIADVSKPPYRTVFSAYREALNATNPFYRLLCFYRVIEGVKKLRTQRRATALRAGDEYREPPDERIPSAESDCGGSDPVVLDSFKPYLGKKFTWVLNQMRSLLRNAVAHLDPEGDTLDADKYEDIATCEQGLPVLKYISRVMLHNELQADSDYRNAPIRRQVSK